MSVHVSHRPEPQAIRDLVNSRPFLRQLDVIIADSEELVVLLSAQRRHSYFCSKVTFSEVFSAFDAKRLQPHDADASPCSVLVWSVGSQDGWYIDHRAILTITLARDAYESLGIIGTPLGPPRCRDMFLITLDLHDTSRQAIRARDCLRQWDVRRGDAGEDGWDVLHSSPLRSDDLTVRKLDIECLTRMSHSIRIPQVLPSPEAEDACDELSALCEWVGLVCIGSPRLNANDAPNPYVALCAFPASWRVGSLTHVRWTGLLTQPFVQSILDTCLGQALDLIAVTTVPISGARNNAWTLIASKSTGSKKLDCVLLDYND